MKPFQSEAGTVLKINLNLLLAFGCGWAGFAIWPRTAEGWSLGLFSLFLGLGAITATAKALGMMTALYARRRAFADYHVQGGRPKSARLASEDDLRRAGMVE